MGQDAGRPSSLVQDPLDARTGHHVRSGIARLRQCVQPHAVLRVPGTADGALAAAAARDGVVVEGGSAPAEPARAVQRELTVPPHDVERNRGRVDRAPRFLHERRERVRVGKGEAVAVAPSHEDRLWRPVARPGVHHGRASEGPADR